MFLNNKSVPKESRETDSLNDFKENLWKNGREIHMGIIVVVASMIHIYNENLKHSCFLWL